jgi:hypothetical protein
MRVWGRLYYEDGTSQWTAVTTDQNGFSDEVYITALAQVCYLSPGESPFYAQYGIPARQSVLSQVYPDYYVARTQQQYAQFFASLILSRLPNLPAAGKDGPTPQYRFGIVTHRGAVLPPMTTGFSPIPQ